MQKRFLVNRDNTPDAYNELCKFLCLLPEGRIDLLKHQGLHFATCGESDTSIPYFQVDCIYYDNARQDIMVSKYMESLYTELDKICKEKYD